MSRKNPTVRVVGSHGPCVQSAFRCEFKSRAGGREERAPDVTLGVAGLGRAAGHREATVGRRGGLD